MIKFNFFNKSKISDKHPYGYKTAELQIYEIYFYRLICLILILVSYSPAKTQILNSFIVHIDLIIIYFWTIYSEKFCSNIFTFILGFVYDITYGLPIGVSSLSLISLSFALSTQRNVFLAENFNIIWLGFAIFSLIGIIFKILLTLLITGNLYFNLNAILNWLNSVFSYVFIHYFFNIIISKRL